MSLRAGWASPGRSLAWPGRLGAALAGSLALGVLIAGLALPAVGGLGLAARSGSQAFLSLPANLTTGPPPVRSRVLAADGSLLATFYLQNRVTVPLAQVPVAARQAVVAIEDSRFYSHHGVDLRGVVRAALTNASSGGVRQGASTLTQQYVKNALLDAATTPAQQRAASADSLGRKAREARYAMALERRLSKDQILERYLNIAYFGHGAYGIATAAGYYFGKPVEQLSLAESALLAGMVQNPSRFDPSSSDPGVRSATTARRDTVLQRMQDLGYIDAAQRAATAATPITTHLTPVPNGCESASVSAPFFCDYVAHLLEDTPVGAALGRTPAERHHALLAGGLTIRTTLDPKVQSAAQAALDARVPRTDPSGAAAATDVVQPGTGEIRAMAVDRTYGQGGGPGRTKVNLATGGPLGFQAGSTFKVFVLAEAIRQGIPLSLRLYAPGVYTSPVFKDVVNGVTKPYQLQNAADSESGTFDVVQATALSVNTFYVQLEERTGVAKPAALAEAMGVHRVVNYVADQPLQAVPAFVLGVNGVSPLDMAAAYATLAAHGQYCPPRAVTAILDRTGRNLPLPATACRSVLEPAVADQVTAVLQTVIDGAQPLRTGAGAQIGRPAAGKTGTVDHSRAAWFVGYTPQLATAVWVGMPDPKTGAPRPMQQVVVNGRYYPSLFGGDIPASIWADTMRTALAGTPVENFTAPPPPTTGVVGVPDVTGQPYDAAVAALAAAGLVGQAGSLVASTLPYGTVAYSIPAGGQQVPAGTTVTLALSSGRYQAAPSPQPSPTAKPSAPAPKPTRSPRH